MLHHIVPTHITAINIIPLNTALPISGPRDPDEDPDDGARDVPHRVAREEVQRARDGHHRSGGQRSHPPRGLRHQRRDLLLRSRPRGGGPLPASGQGARPRQARDAPAPDPEDPPRAGDARADLRAGVHLGRGAARRGVGGRPDQGARLLGALRRPPLEEAMKGYILRRLGYSVISLFLLSVTIFLFVRVTGDPAVLLVEPGASKDELEMIRQQFGLDQPLPVQYGSFITSLLRGDFGQPFYSRTPVLG